MTILLYFRQMQIGRIMKYLRRWESVRCSDKHLFYVGQTVELNYDPNHGEKFEIPRMEQQFEQVGKIFTIVSYVMMAGCVFICLGVCLLAEHG